MFPHKTNSDTDFEVSGGQSVEYSSESKINASGFKKTQGSEWAKFTAGTV